MNEILQKHGLSIVFIIIVLLFVLYYSSDKDNLLRYIHPNELAKMDKNITKDFLIAKNRG